MVVRSTVWMNVLGVVVEVMFLGVSFVTIRTMV